MGWFATGKSEDTLDNISDAPRRRLFGSHAGRRTQDLPTVRGQGFG